MHIPRTRRAAAIVLISAAPLLSGCAAKMTLVRADGQPIAGAAELAKARVSETICDGEAEKAKLSAGANYHLSLFAFADEEIRRAQSASIVGKGCLASHGYFLVDASQAPKAYAASAHEDKAP